MPECAGVRAQVGAVVKAQREKFAVGIERELAGQRYRAAMEIAHEAFAARPPISPAAGCARRARRKHSG
jgi:hypothetical protein